MNYYLAPYQWVNNSWQPPVGTIAAIDLRNLSQMGTPITPDGLGFFVTTGLIRGDLLGNGDLREINTTGLMKSTWNSLLDYNPNGEKLIDFLYDHLTMGSDPTGAIASKPLCPTNGKQELYLNGLVKRKQFRMGHNPESNQVISVFQNDYRQIREDVVAGRLPTDHHRRVLDFWGKQFKLNPDIFIPSDLPKETPLPHGTSLSENFDGADNAVLGKQLTWVEPVSSTFWDNFSNHARFSGEGDEDERAAFVDSALSSADQECTVTSIVQPAVNTADVGCTCRRSNTVVTYYQGIITRGTTTYRVALLKMVTSVATLIGSTVDVTESLPDTVKLTVVGSSLELFFNSVSKISETDTAITGNLFCGLLGRATGTAVEMDDWSAQDISVGAVGNVPAFLSGLLE